MALLFRTFVWLIASVGVGITTQPPSHPQDASATLEYHELLFADFVVRGTIADCNMEYVPVREVYPQSRFTEDGFAKVLRVTMAVDEVLKGWSDEHRLEFVVTDPVNLRSLPVGQEVVVGLKEEANWLGPRTLRLNSADGFFRREEDGWYAYGHWTRGRRHTLVDIKSQLEAVSIPALVRDAEAIFTGMVIDTSSNDSTSADGMPMRMVTISIETEDVFKGHVASHVDITAISRGLYWPPWRWTMPKVVVGDRYCVFKATSQGVEYALGGMNGFYKVVGDTLIYDNTVVTSLKVSDVARMARRAMKEE